MTTENPPADDGAEPTDATDAKGSDATSDPASPPKGSPDKKGDAKKGDVATQLSELTADLQRITAEYHNYRKRVERDRQLAAEQVTATVIAGLLPVLDDIDRAREHGDLSGPFATVSEQLINSLVKLGLEVFGEKGDAFDPTMHEAVAHMHSTEVTEPSCIDVMRRGYRIGERLLRPAMVAVAEPAEAEVEPAEALVESEPAGAVEVVEAEVVEEETDVAAETAETAEDSADSGGDSKAETAATEKDADTADIAEATEPGEKAEKPAEAAEAAEDTKDSETEPEADAKGTPENGSDEDEAPKPKPRRKPSPRPRPREDAADDDKK